jgi:putative transcriptional regulator
MQVSRRALIAGPLLALLATRVRANTVHDTGTGGTGAEGTHVEWPPTKPLTGSFLVSAPGQDSGPFGKSVVFLLEHAAGGAMGVIVNKPVLRESLAQLLEGIGEHDKRTAPPKTEITIYFGGPVQPDAILAVHSRDFTADKTKAINSLAAVSPVEAVLRAVADGKGPHNFILLSGYAGWAPGQLEAELAKAWWIIVPADRDILFGSGDSTKWQRAYDQRSIDL